MEWLFFVMYFLATLVFASTCLVRIAAKAGFPPWYGLLMLIPGVNVAVLAGFAIVEWPLEEQAYRYRMREANEELHDPGYLLKRWLKKAISLEQEGKIDKAIRLYEKIALDANSGNAELAKAAISRLRQESSAIRPV